MAPGAAVRSPPRLLALNAVTQEGELADRVVRRWFWRWWRLWVWRWSVMSVPCPGCSGRALVVVVTRGSSSWWGLVVLMVVFVFSRC